MQVGSLVIWVHHKSYVDCVTPVPEEIYTVRDVLMGNSHERPQAHVAIRVEEITNPYVVHPNGALCEMAYFAGHWAEVQPPMTNELEELLKVPVHEPAYQPERQYEHA